MEDSNIKIACGNKLYIHDPYLIWQLSFLLPATHVSNQLSIGCVNITWAKRMWSYESITSHIRTQVCTWSWTSKQFLLNHRKEAQDWPKKLKNTLITTTYNNLLHVLKPLFLNQISSIQSTYKWLNLITQFFTIASTITDTSSKI